MEVTISSLDAKGRGIAETERGRVVVPFAIPGDTVHVELRGKRKGVWRGVPVERLTDGPERVEPRCPYVGTCGGCPWQMIDYQQQLRYKGEAVRAALKGLALSETGLFQASRARFRTNGVSEVEPSPEVFYYRNRMDYVVGAGGELGLKGPEQWWNVLDLSTCFLLSPDAVEVMSRFRTWMREHHVTPWDHRTHSGFARYLVIREGKRTGERMVMVVTAPGELPGRDDLIGRLQPLATSILWGINPRITDLSIAEEVHVLYGNEVLREELHIERRGGLDARPREGTPHQELHSGTGQVPPSPTTLPLKLPLPTGGGEKERATLTFHIPPNAFFQTNTLMAERLVETVIEFAEPQLTDLVVDLYCGVGVFGIALAKFVERVIGVESDPSAIPIAQRNAETNGVMNARFVLAKSESWSFPIDPIDTLILDPPRAGLHPRVIQKILAMEPKRIIYVSCNPTALARDLKVLLNRYTCDGVRCLDLFPHTPHVEAVVRLERK